MVFMPQLPDALGQSLFAAVAFDKFDKLSSRDVCRKW